METFEDFRKNPDCFGTFAENVEGCKCKKIFEESKKK